MEKTGVEEVRAKGKPRTKLERRRIVEETLAPRGSVTAVARAHGIRPSQVFHWRRLYRQGLLEGNADATALVPVTITDAIEQRFEAKAPVRTTGQARRAVAGAASGMIQVELEKARLCLHGATDPSALRVLLEYLAG